MKSKIWLSSPHMGGAELEYVHQAFSENWIAPLGPNVTGFEKDLEQFLKTEKKVAALSSGTAALHLALILAGVKPNDEVICQSLTFSASANPITYLGAKPVFVDSEALTFNICPEALKQAIVDRIRNGKKPKAVVAVHLYGMPFQITKITAICKQYDMVLIEDAAEALGSCYKNQACGTFGDFTALSFNGNKIITTSGGGALVAAAAETQKAVFLATQARDEAPHYQHSQIGYNYRMSNICAGIGRGQMQVLNQYVSKRRAVHQFYKSILQNVKGVSFQNEPDATYFSNYWLTAILIDAAVCGKSANDLRLALENENIEARPVWKPMHLQPIFADAPYYGNKVAEKLFTTGLCLPSGSNLTTSDLERIKKVLVAFFEIETES
ncbi:aminotransferase class I/II-fold pyridoxal phosphate-dependent enzyme [Flavobacterium agricola]|uniref:Aminotransferase class I/II-fold pyridoxal phosphate-dependent enzyme n=1 Tax=Flavobacterium agricola TaxID=2870839 RepID=A0ABY6LY95_9FLAO|nr:aminotransferase class I/II-fold pyridoxal phosphate-dependent enzyme [Flavobacterium agricola]UYW00522.1 aminotransferase class I/II-fold pyridoxal phosphate-dependent enzyme [Flavobacterium agricola]